ncbi:hypothetical protein PZE06_15700 [Robertmurraya sp. DFI.2.37]|uniref:hypothetical protein n=1 Tax=Robertmurraya sp. DFI.2.37 TaxID=3031819 RepID=UPI0017804EA5|nr:hypothetical protein [Robertmurraya sp. DFI.2.37]MDF1509586.1 hypothetical protein [Robertmurraya sp. DFI.2.37]
MSVNSFNPYFSEKAKMEVNVNEQGVSFVGNSEGYLAFARFFNYLAEVHMSIREEKPQPETNTVYGYGPYHISHYVTKKAIQQGDFIFSPGPIKKLGTSEATQDILFWLSDKIGSDFWKGEAESGATDEWITNAIFMSIEDDVKESD